jgi:hypothetical protein
MARYPHRLLVITASLSEVKSPYAPLGTDPNRITQSLIAVLAGLQVPFFCTETHELGEELSPRICIKSISTIGSKRTYGRFLTDNGL